MAYNVVRSLYFGKMSRNRQRKGKLYSTRNMQIAQHPRMVCSTDWVFKYDILMHKEILDHSFKHVLKLPNKRFDNGLRND